MASSMRITVNGFRFNACYGVCGRCIAPDYEDLHTRNAMLAKDFALFTTLSRLFHDIEDIMAIMELGHLDPEANCSIEEYKATAQQVLQSPYASKDDCIRAEEALQWFPARKEVVSNNMWQKVALSMS